MDLRRDVCRETFRILLSDSCLSGMSVGGLGMDKLSCAYVDMVVESKPTNRIFVRMFFLFNKWVI